jgi:hypothetical protein
MGDTPLSHVKSIKKVAAKMAVGAVAAGVALAGIGSAAWAAPTNAKDATPVKAVCDNGQTYWLVVNGGGNGANSNSGQTFNAAHFITSNSVFTPVSFGESTYSTYINGVLQGSFTQPAAAKGNGNGGPKNATPLNCTYSFTITQTDPTTNDVFTFTGSGTVVGFVRGS